jgi:predicted DNA-binding transcriptional regulator AlpA
MISNPNPPIGEPDKADGAALILNCPETSGSSGAAPPRIGGPHPWPSPLLVTARQAAAMCGKSLRTWRTWDAAGWVPRPVRIGRSTLWRADELREWVDAGCPRREEWEARK